MAQTTPAFLFAGGGTGGHLFPGIAVAEVLLARLPDARIVFAGSDREVESAIVETAGFQHAALPSPPSTLLRRHPLRFAWQYIRASRESRRIISEIHPAAVIGLGGFASVPLVAAAARAKVPVVLLEQNAVAGRATRRLSRFARFVCHTFESAVPQGTRGRNAVITGNPVRAAIAGLAAHDECRNPDDEGIPNGEPRTTNRTHNRDSSSGQSGFVVDSSSGFRHLRRPEAVDPTLRRTLLVLGGSQGSTAVNEAMLIAARNLQERFRGWNIVHQCGLNDGHRIAETYRRLGIPHEVRPFFDDLPERYATAGLAVSRAGATTLAELACAGIPAALIPYPNSIHDHQLRNAEFFAAAGAACLVRQHGSTDETGRQLASVLGSLLQDGEERRRRSQAISELAVCGAASTVADCVLAAASLLPPAVAGSPHISRFARTRSGGRSRADE